MVGAVRHTQVQGLQHVGLPEGWRVEARWRQVTPDQVPLIFRQAPHYIITTGGAGLHLGTSDPARLIDIITGKDVK